ncbi:hypothetical protein [Caudoviricetes sp.]|nr:hypothetical protein [Caudoviricetes sp.]
MKWVVTLPLSLSHPYKFFLPNFFLPLKFCPYDAFSGCLRGVLYAKGFTLLFIYAKSFTLRVLIYAKEDV